MFFLQFPKHIRIGETIQHFEAKLLHLAQKVPKNVFYVMNFFEVSCQFLPSLHWRSTGFYSWPLYLLNLYYISDFNHVYALVFLSILYR